MESLHFEIDGVAFEHNLRPWSLSDPASVCGYIAQATLANPMWYTEGLRSPLADPSKPYCTREQAERAIEAHHAWLAGVMLDPARLAEVQALLAVKLAQEEVEQSERVLAVRRERLNEATANLVALRVK